MMITKNNQLYHVIHFFPVILLTLFVTPCHSNAQSPKDTLYKVGLKAQQNGRWQKALQDWSHAASLPNSTPDPRIGLAYIELATSHNLQSDYPLASKLYFWGFTTRDLNRFHKTIQEETDRLGPLIGDKAHRIWSHELKHGNPAVTDSIRGFWIRNDPLPSTPENERLLEHWRRIAYARTHFTRNRHSVYGTDDRGTLYVKYGPPDFVRKGRLLFEQAFAINLAREIENRTKGEGAADIEIKSIKFLVRIAELNFFYPAEYEIWIYGNLSEENQDGNIYLFGNLRTGGYRELYGVEKLIPGDAFFASDNIGVDPHGRLNFTPGTLLQAMYYEQLSAKARFFGNIYDDLMSSYATSTTTRPSTATYIRHQTRVKLEQQHFKTPKQVSAFDTRITSLPVRLRLFRGLNAQNQPAILVFGYSQPQKVLLAHYLKDHQIHQADLIHYLADYDRSWERIGQKKERGLVDVSDFLNDSTLNNTRTYALLPQQPGGHLTFAARLRNFDAQSTPDDSLTGLSSQLMAAGHITLSLPPALSTARGSLVMSDPVIGYDKSTSSRSVDSMYVPFYVPPRSDIAYGKDIRLHYEIYHLHPDTGGISHYTLHYALDLEKKYRPKKGKTKGKTHASLSLQMRGGGTRTTQNLEIKVEDFVPGLYRLTLTATDEQNRKISQQAEVRILPGVRN